MRYYKQIIISLFLLSFTTCSSRYKLDLFMISEAGNNKVKVEKTDYISNVRLGDPFANIKILPGESNVAILTVGTRGFTHKKDAEDFLTFDEYLRNRIYFQFPKPLKTGTFELKNNSFIHLLGRYDWQAEDKIFLPLSGQVVIDSIMGKNLFGQVAGKYENRAKIKFEFNGQFKLKISD